MKDKLITAVVDLLKVKSLITIAMVFTTCYLALQGVISVEVFISLVASIITYYFTKKDSDVE